jgi:hypothetical protein
VRSVTDRVIADSAAATASETQKPLITADLVSRLNALFGFLRSSILGQDEVLSDVVSPFLYCGVHRLITAAPPWRAGQ